MALSDLGAWAMTILSSVGIIMANKHVMSARGYNFTFATTLTAFHFAVTAGVGYMGTALGYVEQKELPFWDVFLFCLLSNISIVSMNLSLMLNSVGLYQISKLSMIPVVCLMEWCLHSKTYTKEVKMTVFVTMWGVGICTITDVHMNFPGLLAVVIAVVTTSLQHVLIGRLQEKHKCGSFELLSITAPIQAASLLASGPLIDYVICGRNVLTYNFTPGAIFFISLSCALAVLCNLSQYICIGRFSAVSFQILGHMKTVAVLSMGWLLFDSVLTAKNLLGMAIAVVGMILYSWAMEDAKKQAAKTVVMGLTTGEETDKEEEDEEDIFLLKSGLGQERTKL